MDFFDNFTFERNNKPTAGDLTITVTPQTNDNLLANHTIMTQLGYPEDSTEERWYTKTTNCNHNSIDTLTVQLDLATERNTQTHQAATLLEDCSASDKKDLRII